MCIHRGSCILTYVRNPESNNNYTSQVNRRNNHDSVPDWVECKTGLFTNIY